jgi:hypothetical protein
VRDPRRTGAGAVRAMRRGFRRGGTFWLVPSSGGATQDMCSPPTTGHFYSAAQTEEGLHTIA